MPGISVNDVLECITECIIENEDTELFVCFFLSDSLLVQTLVWDHCSSCLGVSFVVFNLSFSFPQAGVRQLYVQIDVAAM